VTPTAAPTAALRASSLFESMPEFILGDLGRLMSPVSYEQGELVFKQGDEGHHLIVVETGELEALRGVPGGQSRQVAVFGSGDVVGELSLLGDGRRMATVRAVAGATGWALERVAFDILRNELRHEALAVTAAIGRLAVDRLGELYARIESELTGAPTPAPWAEDSGPQPTGERPDLAYLMSTLFFREYNPLELAVVTEQMRCLFVPRGGIIEHPGQMPEALWIVARGAVETTIRATGESRRMRLAGPGRAVGHMGLLGDPALVARRESRARERAVLLEVPWEAVQRLLTAQDRSSRRFATAMWTDTVRALEHAQRPAR
jgi:CRP-like cAMP-binding protein